MELLADLHLFSTRSALDFVCSSIMALMFHFACAALHVGGHLQHVELPVCQLVTLNSTASDA